MQSKSQILLVLLLLHLYKSFHLHSTICGVTKEKCVCRWFGTITFNIIFATVHRLRYFSSTAFRKPDMSYWSRYVILIQICHIDPGMSYWSRYAILIQIRHIDPDMSHWSRYVLLIRLTLSSGPKWARSVAPLNVATETHPVSEALRTKKLFLCTSTRITFAVNICTLHYSEDSHYILWKVQFEASLKRYWLYHSLLAPSSGVCVQQQTMKVQQLHFHTQCPLQTPCAAFVFSSPIRD